MFECRGKVVLSKYSLRTLVIARRRSLHGAARLEIFLGMAVVALVVQLFPTARDTFATILDIRTWGPLDWACLSAVLIAVLFAIRHGAELVAAVWGALHAKKPGGRSNSLVVRDASSDWRELDEKSQRELFQRMQEARKKQVV